jgi:hypothetical protein
MALGGRERSSSRTISRVVQSVPKAALFLFVAQFVVTEVRNVLPSAPRAELVNSVSLFIGVTLVVILSAQLARILSRRAAHRIQPRGVAARYSGGLWDRELDG